MAEEIAREQRIYEREQGARDEVAARYGEVDEDAFKSEPVEISDSERKEAEEADEWRRRVAAEKERHLRLYQLGKNPVEEEALDAEAAEEVRQSPTFAALAQDHSGVQNLAEGATQEEAAAIRSEQKRQADFNSQDDTVQRSGVPAEAPVTLEVEDSQEDEVEDPQDLNADELVELIEKAGSVEEVDRLAADDDRKTVNKAAEKRKEEL